MGVSVPELLPSLLNFLTLGKYFFFVLSVFPDFGFKKRKTGRKKKKSSIIPALYTKTSGSLLGGRYFEQHWVKTCIVLSGANYAVRQILWEYIVTYHAQGCSRFVSQCYKVFDSSRCSDYCTSKDNRFPLDESRSFQDRSLPDVVYMMYSSSSSCRRMGPVYSA